MQIRTFYLASLFIVFSGLTLMAQDAAPGPGSVTVFSEDGENFTLYLNGDRKNASASTRVVADVVEEAVSFRIVFENNTTPEIKKNGLRGGANCLYAISKNKKGERVLKIKECSEEKPSVVVESTPQSNESVTPVVVSRPDKLSASYANGIITINDGRTLTVKKVKANGMTYPKLIMTALTGAKVSIAFDGNDEKFGAESPLEYEVKDFSNNNAYFTLTVDEGGADRTWKVKLQNSNGYDLKIE